MYIYIIQIAHLYTHRCIYFFFLSFSFPPFLATIRFSIFFVYLTKVSETRLLLNQENVALSLHFLMNFEVMKESPKMFVALIYPFALPFTLALLVFMLCTYIVGTNNIFIFCSCFCVLWDIHVS